MDYDNNDNIEIKAFTALEIVQEELQNEKDKRKEERLGWGLFCIICLDGAIFPNTNLGATTFIFIIELILLIHFAPMCGCEHIAKFSKIILSKITNNKS